MLCTASETFNKSTTKLSANHIVTVQSKLKIIIVKASQLTLLTLCCIMKGLLVTVLTAYSLLTVVLANPVSDREITAQFLTIDAKYTVKPDECALIKYAPKLGIYKYVFACDNGDQGMTC